MVGALRRLLDGAIDYAGIFPPARLEMAQAVDNFLTLTHGPDAWIVGRFVCSAGRLPELLTELNQHSPDEVWKRDPVRVAVVGTAAADHKHWGHSLEHDAASMDKFARAAEGRAVIEALEIRVPDHVHLDEYVNDLRSFDNIDVFVELPWAPELRDSLALLAEAEFAGAKARTGGLEKAAFPSVSDLAGFIQQCVHLDLRYKCTAGLHEPLPHEDAAIGARQHGFLNILAATTLALTEDLSRSEIEALLNEADGSAFQLSDTTLAWNGHTAGLDAMEEAREVFVGFGSCSIEEPLEGLRRLGSMEAAR